MAQTARSVSQRKPLPLTETGFGYSRLFVGKQWLWIFHPDFFTHGRLPRRYTSREVVGILRNRPCFRHAQAKDRKGGIRWRLDVLALEKYLTQKGYKQGLKKGESMKK